MKVIDNIFNRVKKNFNNIGVFVGIVGVTVFILRFGIKIDDKGVDVLTAFAVPFTVFFMFLAFRENKKSNELKIGEPIFNYLKDEVNLLLKKGDEEVISTERISFLSEISKYPLEYIQRICPNVFDYHLTELLKHIEKNSSYKRYIKLLGNNSKLPLEYKTSIIDDAQQLSLAFQMIRLCTSHIYHYYYAIFETCERIHTSPLEERHKEILLEKLLENTGNLEELCNDLQTNKESIVYLRDFVALELNSDNDLISYKFAINNQFVDINKKIKEITNIYFE